MDVGQLEGVNDLTGLRIIFLFISTTLNEKFAFILSLKVREILSFSAFWTFYFYKKVIKKKSSILNLRRTF